MHDVINATLLGVFIPTFFFVSATPGLCMTLSMALGIRIGFRLTLWMMLGELLGVALVATSAVVGIAAIMSKYPQAFQILKYIGGLYLAYIGITMWLSKGKLTLITDGQTTPSRKALFSQGFMTAIANPKGWAFFIALLPPFIDNSKPLFLQLSLLIGLIVMIEFTCLSLYCLGGRAMKTFLQKSGNVRLLNQISGALIIGVAIWLILG